MLAAGSISTVRYQPPAPVVPYGMLADTKYVYRRDYGNITANSATLISVGDCGYGTTVNTHVGQQVAQHFVDITLQVSMPKSYIRLVLLYDKQTNGLTPAATDVFESSTTTLLSPILHSALHRFDVLADDVVSYTPASDSVSQLDVLHIRQFFGVPYVKTYSSNTSLSGVASVVSGNFWLVFLTLTAGTYQCICKTYFTDKS